MFVKINIKADVENLSISEIYELLQLARKSKFRDNNPIPFKGFYFKVKTEIDTEITHYVTEI